MWTVALSSPAAVGELEDGRTTVLVMNEEKGGSLYTLDPSVTRVAGLEVSGGNLLHIEMKTKDTQTDIILAEIGISKPRPKLLGVQCLDCGSIFRKHFSLTRHMKLHEVTDPLVCKECLAVFKDKFYYNAHRATCLFYCPFRKSSRSCTFKSKSKIKVKAHMKKQHRYDSIDNDM